MVRYSYWKNTSISNLVKQAKSVNNIAKNVTADKELSSVKLNTSRRYSCRMEPCSWSVWLISSSDDIFVSMCVAVKVVIPLISRLFRDAVLKVRRIGRFHFLTCSHEMLCSKFPPKVLFWWIAEYVILDFHHLGWKKRKNGKIVKFSWNMRNISKGFKQSLRRNLWKN